MKIIETFDYLSSHLKHVFFCCLYISLAYSHLNLFVLRAQHLLDRIMDLITYRTKSWWFSENILNFFYVNNVLFFCELIEFHSTLGFSFGSWKSITRYA